MVDKILKVIGKFVIRCLEYNGYLEIIKSQIEKEISEKFEKEIQVKIEADTNKNEAIIPQDLIKEWLYGEEAGQNEK